MPEFSLTIELTPSTAVESQSGDALLIGREVGLTFNVADGESFTFTAGHVYRLTIKHQQGYAGRSITIDTLTYASTTQLTGVLDLNDAEFWNLKTASPTVAYNIRDITGDDTIFDGEFALTNVHWRSSDTIPPSTSTDEYYTKDEVDALNLGAGFPQLLDAHAGEADAHADLVSQDEAEAGTETAIRSWNALRIAQAIAALAADVATFAWENITGKPSTFAPSAHGSDHTDGTDDIQSATSEQKGLMTATQAVDLETIKSRVNELDAAVVLKGAWDASAGTFPGAGAAEAGWSYQVTVAGTVDGVAFSVNDRLIALVDNAATDTYAANWLKADYTDVVTSVAGLTGAPTASQLRTAISVEENADVTDAENVAAAGAHMANGTDVPVADGGTGASTAAAARANLGAQAADSGTTLPTGDDIVTGQIFRLTAADTTAKAPPGLYVHDGTAWLCMAPFAVYDWGDLGATPTLALITGAMYTWTVSAEVTGATITLSREGVAAFVSSNGDGNAWTEGNTTATGRTIKDVEGSAFTNLAETAGATGTIADDGTNLWITAAKDA